MRSAVVLCPFRRKPVMPKRAILKINLVCFIHLSSPFLGSYPLACNPKAKGQNHVRNTANPNTHRRSTRPLCTSQARPIRRRKRQRSNTSAFFLRSPPPVHRIRHHCRGWVLGGLRANSTIQTSIIILVIQVFFFPALFRTPIKKP